jgi:hypothetical protein
VRTGLAECRRCTQPIRFVQLDSGKAMPINPAPNPAGNVCARSFGGRLVGFVISREHPAKPGWQRFTAHYATCESRPKSEPKPAPEPDPALF